MIILALALSGCTSNLKPVTKDGGKLATATGQETGSTTAGTEVLKIPAIDLDGLKTVTIDVGALKGFTVQAPNGIDPSTELSATLSPEATFPLEVDGTVALAAKIRIGLPEFLLAGIDLMHPETIAIYARKKDGTIFQLPPEDVTVEAPKLYVMIGEYLSLVVVQSRPALAITTATITQVGGNPTVSWTSAPIGKDPLYEIQVFDSGCQKLIQSQATKTSNVAIAPPLAAGDYCVKVLAKIGDGTLAQSGEPLLLHILPSTLTDFTFSYPTGQTAGTSTPVVTWSNAPRLADPSATYDIKICSDAACTTIEAQASGLTVTTFTPGSPLPDGVHHIVLTAKNGAGEVLDAVNSGAFVLTTDTAMPSTFSIAGASGADSGDTTPTISWGASTDPTAVTYDVKLSLAADCSSPVAQSSGLTVTSFTAAAPLGDGLYHVCVRATDAGAHPRDASNSGTWTVRVDDTSPSPFTILGPTSPSSTGKPSISWSAATDATAVLYDVQLYQSGCTSLVEQSLGLAASPYVVTTQLLTANSYCIKVTAKDALAHSRPATNTSYPFTVTVAKPGDPAGASATPGVLSNALLWTTGSSATGYLVIRKPNSAVDYAPIDGTAYTAGASYSGNTIAALPSAPNASDTGLTAGTTYYYAIYARNDALAYSALPTTTSGTPTAGSTPAVVVSLYDGTNVKILKFESGSPSVIGTIAVSQSRLVSLAFSLTDSLHYVKTTSPPDFISSSVGSSGGAFSSPYQEVGELNAGHVSLAMDSQGKNHVALAAYYDVKYASGINEATWPTPELIRADPSTSGSSDISIALDSHDKPHVVFMQFDVNAGTNSIFYANRITGSWALSTAGALNNNGNSTACTVVANPRFALDAYGFAHVAYVCDGTVVYATNKTGAWTYSGVDSGNAPDIAVTPTGTPTVAYYKSANIYAKELIVSTWTGGAVANQAVNYPPRIGYDGNGKLHLVCFRTTSSLKVDHFTNESGSFVLDGSYTATGGADFSSTMTIKGAHGNGNFALYQPELAMAYLDVGVKVMKRTSAWTLGSTPNGQTDGNVVIDKNGWIRAGFSDTGALKYKMVDNVGGSFGSPADIRSVGIISSVGISVDSNSQIHAAYSDGDDVYLITQVSNAWGAPVAVKTQTQAMMAGSIDIALDGNDKDHIVYTSPDSMSLSPIYYSTNASGSMVTTAAVDLNKTSSGTACGTQASNPSIAVTRAGKAYISYTCNDFTTVATNVSGSWAYSASGYNGQATRSKIVLDANDVPYTITRDFGGALTVHWGPTFASSWGVANPTAQVNPAIAVDALNTIHVIWQDASYNIKHSWRYATGQTGVETVASPSNNVTLFRSLGISGVLGQGNY